MKRILIAVLALTVFVAGASVATAKRGGETRAPRSGCSRSSPIRPSTAIPRASRSTSARARSTSASPTDGAIYRGSLKSDTVEPFIPGAAGKSAVGLKVKRGKLYVAGGSHRLDHRLRPRHQGAGREVRDRRRRLPQRPRRDPRRRRLRDRLTPPEAVARDRRAGRGRQRHAAGSRRQRDPVSRQGRTTSTSTASSRRARASSSWSTPTAASCSGSSSATTAARSMTDSTRSPAPRCPAATACCSTRASSWSSRATRPSCRS